MEEAEDKMSLSDWFNSDFEVYRKVYEDQFNPESWDFVGTIKGFLQPRSGTIIFTEGSEKPTESLVLYTFATSDLQAYDRIKDADGVMYYVQFSQRHGIAGTDHHIEAFLELLEGE